jgi:hypothetical protein
MVQTRKLAAVQRISSQPSISLTRKNSTDRPILKGRRFQNSPAIESIAKDGNEKVIFTKSNTRPLIIV